MEKIKINRQMSESMLIAALLAVVGGFLDAYTYVFRGGVFANAQTGNIVLLGIHLSKGEWGVAFGYLIPIFAFALGIAVTEAVRRRAGGSRLLHWRQGVVLAEVAILFVMGWIPAGTLDYFVNLSIAFVCALQAQSFRKVNGNAYASTMCTGNLRSATQSLYFYWVNKDKKELFKSIQYYMVIAFFIIGAAMGALLTRCMGYYSVWVADAVLLAAFFLMFIKKDF